MVEISLVQSAAAALLSLHLLVLFGFGYTFGYNLWLYMHLVVCDALLIITLTLVIFRKMCFKSVSFQAIWDISNIYKPDMIYCKKKNIVIVQVYFFLHNNN